MNAVGLDRLDARNPKTGGLAPDLGHAFLDYPADPDGSDWAMSERRVELTVLTPAALELREEASPPCAGRRRGRGRGRP